MKFNSIILIKKKENMMMNSLNSSEKYLIGTDIADNKSDYTTINKCRFDKELNCYIVDYPSLITTNIQTNRLKKKLIDEFAEIMKNYKIEIKTKTKIQ